MYNNGNKIITQSRDVFADRA